MIENNKTEFKNLKKIVDSQGKLKSEGLRDLAITCVSFANAQGGIIIIGIEDYKSLPPADQKIDFKIVNETITRLRSLTFNVSLSLNDLIKASNGGEYFGVFVHPTLKSIATTADGKIYIRIADQCQPGRGEDIVRLASEKDAFQWELQSRNLTLNDIPEKNIINFAQEIRKSDRVKLAVKTLTNLEILEHYYLVEKNILTNLGILWLGSPAQKSRLAYPLTVQYIVYDDSEKKVRKEDWHDHSLNPKELILEIEKNAIELI